MRYVSIFSGVEAATVAWDRLGWQPLAFAEVDEFPCAVLAHRFPNVPNLGDVCNIDWEEFNAEHGAIDVLIGGSPCQSFSIAGSREGLQGESRLMYEYVRAVRDLVRASGGRSPRYIVWENVPGCLTSNKGRDFNCLLDALEECGYFVAWRTLDSQFARVFDRSSGRFRGPVPQRRRRVYLVGSLGGPSAADILFERQSLRGNHPKVREARQALAEAADERAPMGDGARIGDVYCIESAQSRAVIEKGTAPTLNASHERPIVCAADDNGKTAIEEDMCGSLKVGGGSPWIATPKSYMLKVRGGANTYTKWDGKTGTAGKGALMGEESAFTLSAQQDQTLFHYEDERYVVRRLMPIECERLQAFPDNWTDLEGCDVDSVTDSVAKTLGYDGERREVLKHKVGRWSRNTSDAPRYKAMGNSMTTNVIEIIGRRIQAYDELHYDEVGYAG